MEKCEEKTSKINAVYTKSSIFAGKTVVSYQLSAVSFLAEVDVAFSGLGFNFQLSADSVQFR